MSSAEGIMPPTAVAAPATADASATGAPPRRRLFRKYALLFIGLVAAALLVTSGFDFWFSYQETKAALLRLQQEKALAAAERIEGFVEEIERQIGWTTHAQWAGAPLDQRRQDYFRLLRQVPAITEVRQLDAGGREQLKVSRLAMDAVGSTEDLSQNAAFLGAKTDRLWFSPVYFRKQSEPYITMAIVHQGRNAGVTIAEINLKLIWDVINDLKIGRGGYAYVADGTGRLIAHPDISLVLRGTDLSGLPQIAAALAPGKRPGDAADAATVAENLAGKEVLSARAPIKLLGWSIFVEAPLSEAFAPLYGAAWRTFFLLVGGLAVAILLALVLARRMTGPIHAIAAGAERFGAGEFGRRIQVNTGDELEALAGQFNRMAGDLQRSYTELEQRVAERTAELSEALEQQTATAEVLGVINASPGDLAPVFDAMLEKAMRLCEADEAALRTFDGELLHLAAVHGSEPDVVGRLRQLGPTRAFGLYEPFAHGERVAHYPDVRETAVFRENPIVRERLEIRGIRSWLAVALQKDGVLLGVINVHRHTVKPFTDKQIALLENFAAQAVIAIENARLITETREALEQQTATAEVLQVINSSPGDLGPVFDAMLEKAHSLCGAELGALFTYDGEIFWPVAAHGWSPRFAESMRQGFRPAPSNPFVRVLEGEQLVHVADIWQVAAQFPDDAALRGAVENGLHTFLVMPLRKDDVLLGVITALRHEVRPFSDKQIALLQNFAAQAVIAMENARLITETREALEQQTATAEVLGVINSSPGDLAPVFEAILAKAMELCGAAFGIMAAQGGQLRPVATRGVPSAYEEFVKHNPPQPGQPGIAARIRGGEPFVHVVDLKDDDLYRSGDRQRRAMVDLGGARSSLIVGLRKDRDLLGGIQIYRQEVRPFTDKQIALLQNFAAQAVIAIENARLLNELRDRTRDLQESLEYQTATSDVLKGISRAAFDLDSVLNTVVEAAARLCGADHAGLYRNQGGEYRWAAGYNQSPEYECVERSARILPGPGTIVGRAVQALRPVQILDVQTDPLYEPQEDAKVGNAHSMLGVPLLREGQPIGVIGLSRTRIEPYSDKQVELVSTFADQAVIAIENARLLTELRERTDELARSVEELKALSEVGQAVSSTLDIGEVLSTILNRSVALTGSDAGAIFRYRRRTRSFRLFEAVGWDDALTEQIGKLDIPEDATRLGNATERRVSVQVPDLERRAGNPLRDVTLAAGYRSVLIVPLVGPDRILGAIVLQRRAPGEFPEASVRLMQTIASQSVLAIQNARLFREIAEKSEQLAEASRHKSQFLANMSHELRTPMNAILGYAELMADGIYGELPPRAAGVLERVQNNGQHLLALINDVLDLSKIEAGQLVFTLEDYSLGEVVRSVVGATEGMARNKGLALTAEIAPGLPTGHADARRLQQVLLNLVGNAIKFTDAGEVAIGAAAEGGNFVLSVRDTGPGIAPEDHSRIFDEFQQVDSSTTRKQGGTGLGLAISKRMIEMQGGAISVESELGRGATFRVALPIRVAEIIDETAGAASDMGAPDRLPALRGAA